MDSRLSVENQAAMRERYLNDVRFHARAFVVAERLRGLYALDERTVFITACAVIEDLETLELHRAEAETMTSDEQARRNTHLTKPGLRGVKRSLEP